MSSSKPTLVVDNPPPIPLLFQPKGPDNTGDPPGGDMLPRIERLEDDMKEVKADLKVLVKDVAEIKGKLGMLPGWGGLMLVTGFIVSAVGVMLRFMPPASPG